MFVRESDWMHYERVKLFQTSTFILLNTKGLKGVLREALQLRELEWVQNNWIGVRTLRGFCGRITIIEELKQIQFKNHHRISEGMHFGWFKHFKPGFCWGFKCMGRGGVQWSSAQGKFRFIVKQVIHNT